MQCDACWRQQLWWPAAPTCQVGVLDSIGRETVRQQQLAVVSSHMETGLGLQRQLALVRAGTHAVEPQLQLAWVSPHGSNIEGTRMKSQPA